LSAKHLPPTEPENRGLVSREKMGSIKGRSRKEQLALAKHFGMTEPPNAAGGCLLTDPAFSNRVKDLIDHTDTIPSLNDIELLKVGRHFRISDDAKLVVGRNKDENELIMALASDNDVVMEVEDYVGPTCILRRSKVRDNSLFAKCASIAMRYSDAPKVGSAKVSVTVNGIKSEILSVTPADSGTIATSRI